MNKVALITGDGGQDAYYLADLLLDKGYEVHGLGTSSRVRINNHINHIVGSVINSETVSGAIRSIKPTHIFNLAAQSNVKYSWRDPHTTTSTNVMGTLNVLEAVRVHSKNTKIFQASSSEMFGAQLDPDSYQRETTAMSPITPYGLSKLYAHKMCSWYREHFGLFVSCGIMFNHESPRRPDTFLTTKIAKAAASIKAGKEKTFTVGNIDVSRDWGHADDYMEAATLMLEHSEPLDLVISSMKAHSVEYLIDHVFNYHKLNYRDYIVQDPKLMRSIDQRVVIGDSSKLRSVLGWKPKYTFESMLDEISEHWYKEIKNG